MKKILVYTIFVAVMVLVSTCFTFADNVEEPVNDPINPEYVTVKIVTAQLAKSNGEALCRVNAEAKDGSTANKMVVTVKYIKQNVGTVGTRTATAYRSGVSFTATTRMALTSSGSYHCKVTVQFYNGSTLLESINILTNTISY